MSHLTNFFKSLWFRNDTHPQINDANQFPNRTLPAIEWQMIDREAIVTQEIGPHKPGQIKFHGSWWTARCNHNATVIPGAIVYVVGYLNATTLYVDVEHNSFLANSGS